MFSSSSRCSATDCTASVLLIFLDLQPRAVRHVEEVGIAAGVELVGPVELHAALGEQVGQHAVDDGGAQLRLDVVADDRDAGLLEALRPALVAGDEDRDVVDEGDARFERAFGVEFGRLLAADRQVVEQHVGAGLAQHLDHLLLVGSGASASRKVRSSGASRHMLGIAVEHRPIRTFAPEGFGHMVAEDGVQLGLAKIASPTSLPTLRGRCPRRRRRGCPWAGSRPGPSASARSARWRRHSDNGRCPAPASSRNCRRRRWRR
jgi:hypothetical protein